MVRRLLLCALLALPLSGCHAIMGAATGLSRPAAPASTSPDCPDGQRCVGD